MIVNRPTHLLIFFLLIAAAVLVHNPVHAQTQEPVDTVIVAAYIKLTSTAFKQGESIPVKYTCDGADISPPLQWHRVPYGTRSIALIVDDPDAPAGTWVHWLYYNRLPEPKALPEGVADEMTPEGGVHGKNSFERLSYGGPCPPPGKPHRYFFKIFMLDVKLPLAPGASKAELERAMQPHILGLGELMGTYQRK